MQLLLARNREDIVHPYAGLERRRLMPSGRRIMTDRGLASFH